MAALSPGLLQSELAVWSCRVVGRIANISVLIAGLEKNVDCFGIYTILKIKKLSHNVSVTAYFVNHFCYLKSL